MRRVTWVVMLLCISLLVTSCGGVGSKAQETVKIALIAPLTGSQADVGDFNKKAVEMAVADVNAAGGIEALGGAELELVVVDSTSDPGQAVSAAQRLLDTENVVAAVGLGISGLTLAIQPVFERARVPLLVHSIADDITDKGPKFTFRIAPKGSQFGKTQVEFLKYLNEKYGLNLTKAAVVYEDSDYGATTAEGIRDIAKEANLEIVLYQSYPHGLTDASPIVSAIARSGADVLFPVGYTTDAKLIIDTMAEMGVKPLIIGGGAGFIWPVMGQTLGDRVNGLFSVASWNWDSKHIMDNTKLRDIVERYKERYGTFMPEHAGMAYAEVWAVVTAINMAGSADPVAVAEALRQIEFTDGPVTLMQPGHVTFDENGWHDKAHPVIIQWQDGEPRTVYPEELASRRIIGVR